MKVEIKNFSFKYQSAASSVFEDINLTIESGEFVVIAGESGCGKTTLLKWLKPELAPAGEHSGEIVFDGLGKIFPQHIGYVFQNPDDGIVCDKVWHELVFSLENQGMSQDEMKEKLDLAAEYFGIKELLFKDVKELSGGQKQIINLAAVAISEPKLLILDEPVSQLDHEMSEAFLEFIRKLNQENGVTIIMSEHRLNEVSDAADKIVLMEKGRINEIINPDELKFRLDEINKACINNTTTNNSFVAENKVSNNSDYYSHDSCDFGDASTFAGEPDISNDTVLELDNVTFSYKRGQNVLENFTIKVNRGEVLVLSGDNGSGKTTALLLLAGGMKPQKGKVIRRVRSGMVPQNPMDIFAAEPLNLAISKETADMLGLSEVFFSHPYDLSGGQQQRLAFALVLDANPDVVILDEPTKGLDSASKNDLKTIIANLKSKGKTVVLVSHDLEFCTSIADRVVKMNRIPRNLPKISDVTIQHNTSAVDITTPPSNQEAIYQPESAPIENHKIRHFPKPAVWTITIALILGTILGDLYLFSGKHSVLISFVVIIMVMIPFLVSIERKRHSARQLAVLAVISAIAVISRAAFFMLPEFKPMAAFIIIAALSFGEEEGFLVGALSALVSNFFFGQGPWTPWQMLAFGLIGFLSGMIYKNKDLAIWNNKKKILLCLTGALLVIFVYGGLINLSSVLMWNQYPSLTIIIASYVTGFPMDCIHAFATVVFLWIFTVPMLEKLKRVKTKYQNENN